MLPKTVLHYKVYLMALTPINRYSEIVEITYQLKLIFPICILAARSIFDLKNKCSSSFDRTAEKESSKRKKVKYAVTNGP